MTEIVEMPEGNKSEMAFLRVIGQRQREQAAAEERAQIVAWLRDDADQVVNADNPVSCADIIAEAIVECAIAIEAGEHLK